MGDEQREEKLSFRRFRAEELLSKASWVSYASDYSLLWWTKGTAPILAARPLSPYTSTLRGPGEDLRGTA